MEEIKTEVCVHYWIIDPPDGPVSRGLCRDCREVRDFKNFLDSDSVMWDSIKSVGFVDLRVRIRDVERREDDSY